MSNPLCNCGHRAERHEIEQPYCCYDCGCKGFEHAGIEPLPDSTNDVTIEEVSAFGEEDYWD